jgi:hypothetical protein
LDLEVYPELTDTENINLEYTSYLKFSPKAANQILMNSGISNNRTSIGSFTKGEKYLLNLEAFSNLLSQSSQSFATNYSIRIGSYEFETDGTYSITDIFKNINDNVWECDSSVSESEFKNKKIGIFI